MNIDRLLYAILSDAVGDRAAVVNEIPPADKIKNDFVVFSEVTGSSPWPGVHERVTYVFDSWVSSGSAHDRLTRCKALGDDVRLALFNARGKPTEFGGINFTGSLSRPTLIPSGIDGVYRVNATYDLSIRP